MYIKRRLYFCLIALLLSFPSSGEENPGSKRALRQTADGAFRISRSEELTEDSLEGLPNVVITLDTPELELTETLTVNHPGVSLVGGRRQPTIIRCPRKGTKEALRIRGGVINLSNIEFTGCMQSAVVVEPNKAKSVHVEVIFERAVFTENGRQGSDLLGGAVRVNACAWRSCSTPILRFDGCRFTRNLAAIGGALFANDAVLQIDGSDFVANEAGLTGGAIYVRGNQSTRLRIQDSHFSKNTARGEATPDALAAEILDIDDAINATGWGGAIFADRPDDVAVLRTSFSNNQGCNGGGAVTVISGASLKLEQSKAFVISNSEFVGNDAFCLETSSPRRLNMRETELFDGGAVLIKAIHTLTTPWRIQSSNFSENRALRGGAVALEAHAPGALNQIQSCVMEDNVALRAGADMAVRASNADVMGSVFRRGRAIYGGSILAWRAAFVRFVPSAEDRPSSSLIEGATAFYGGAILVSRQGALNLAALTIRNNTAYRAGGGIRLSGNDPLSTFRGVNVDGNSALVGGGLSSISSTQVTLRSFEGQPSVFRGNTAAFAGGIHFQAGDLQSYFIANVSDTLLVGNRALPATSPDLLELFEEGLRYHPGPFSSVTQPTPMEGSLSQLLRSLVPDDYEGHGGGITIALQGMSPLSAIEVTIQNVQIEGNEATVGGGMSILQPNISWNPSDITSCSSAVLGIDGCHRFTMHNVSIRNNRALYAGGLYVTQPEDIDFSCRPGDDVQRLNSLSSTEISSVKELQAIRPACSEILGNALLTGPETEGANVGARAASLAVEGACQRLREVASGERLQIDCDEEKDPGCSELRIAVQDAFGQTIRQGSLDAELQLVLESPNITGALRYVATNGLAAISDTRARGIRIEGSFIISSERDRRVNLELEFSTRQCYPGEIRQVEICQQCPPEQYAFNFDQPSCHPCEPNANCSDGTALIPLDGYWHSTPFSPVFTKCIDPAACTYEGRQDDLHSFFKDLVELQACLQETKEAMLETGDAVEFTNYRQCDEGYEGPMCGSCQPGYGHSFSGTCQKCPDRQAMHNDMVVLSTLLLYFLIGLNCLFNLTSMKSRVQLVKHEIEMSRQRHPPPLRRQLAKRNLLPRSSQNIVRRSTGGDESNSSSRGRLSLVTAREVIATAQLTETLKILVNYLQVTSVAARLHIKWDSTLNGYLNVTAFLAGVLPTALVSVPFECNFKDDAMAAVNALWVRLAIPWIVLVCLVATFVVVWVFNAIRQRINGLPEDLSRERFLTSVIAISVVSIYFSYIDVVREVVTAVNCVRIRSAAESVGADHPYVMYALEQRARHVWAEDTTLECFRGPHLPVGIVGVAGLVISLMGIISIIAWLPLNRKRMTKPYFVARYWFLYQAYKKHWYTLAWESTILTRKCLIAAVVVFSYRIDPIMQSTLCAGLLTLCLFLTFLLLPFKIPEGHKSTPVYAGGFFRALRLPKMATAWVKLSNAMHLNILEAGSLAASISMFYSVVVAHAETSSRAGRICMTTFTFTVNASYLLYMLYRLYVGMHVVLDSKLERCSDAAPNGAANELSIFGFVRKARHWMMAVNCDSRRSIHVDDQTVPQTVVELTSTPATSLNYEHHQ